MSTSEQRAKWAEAARKRYWAMTPEQRRAHNANRKNFKQTYDPAKARQRYRRRNPDVKNGGAPKQQRRMFVLQLKFERGACEHCGLEVDDFNHPIMQWDHIDPSQKSFTLSRAAHHANLQLADVRAETEKCQLLCANCHGLRTYWERHHDIGDCRGKQSNSTEELRLFDV